MKGKKREEKAKKEEPQKEYVPKSIMPCAEGFRVVIGAKPNSKESKVMEINDEYIGVAIAAPPKEGEANDELLSFLASVLGVKKNTVYLDKGSKSRNKVAVVESKELTLEQVFAKLKSDMEG
jgi:uncharacterized protein (TIGR00251 family)